MNNSYRSKIDVDVFSLIVGVCTLLEFFVCMCVYKGWKATLIIFEGKCRNFTQRVNIICYQSFFQRLLRQVDNVLWVYLFYFER